MYSVFVDADVSEFPFVEALPKREKSKFRTLWEQFEDFVAQAERTGPLIPQSLAASLLGVSRQRVSQIVKDGRLVGVELPNGNQMVTGNSLVEFCKLERKNGRPTLIETESTLSLAKRALKNTSK